MARSADLAGEDREATGPARPPEPVLGPAEPGAQPHERATRRAAADFLHALVAAVSCRIPTVLTDNSLPRTRGHPVRPPPDRRSSRGRPRQPAGLPRASRGSGWSMPSVPARGTASRTEPAHPLRGLPAAFPAAAFPAGSGSTASRPVLLNRTALLLDDRSADRSWPSLDERAGPADEPDDQRKRPSNASTMAAMTSCGTTSSSSSTPTTTPA
jgi:hypothetical protein